MPDPFTDTIALYLGYTPKGPDPFSSIVITGLLDRLRDYNKDLLIFGDFRWQPQGRLLDILGKKMIDGMIFIPPIDHPLTTAIAETGLPIVAIADQAPGIVSVVVNDEMGAFMLAEHLALRGYHKVMFRKDPSNHPSGVIRLNSFVKSAEYLGLEVRVTLPKDNSGALSLEEEKILLTPDQDRPGAVVNWSDTFAYALLRFTRQNNLNVPKDIAVAGFDGIISTIEPNRRLTTVQAPWYRVAEKAVDLLIQLSLGEDVIRDTVLPVDLIIGDTT